MSFYKKESQQKTERKGKESRFSINVVCAIVKRAKEK